MRLGFGEYDWPGASVDYARSVFMEEVWSRVPAAGQELWDMTLPLYRSLRALPTKSAKLASWVTCCRSQSAEIVKLRNELQAWGERWHLAEDWVFDTLLATLKDWCEDVELGPGDVAIRGKTLPSTPVTGRFVYRSWEPFIETRRDAEVRITDEFKKYLQDELDLFEWVLNDEGYKKVPTKRARTNIRRHFEWLVRYQVLGESKGDIADEHSDADHAISAVEKALRSLATLIGLSLRPDS